MLDFLIMGVSCSLGVWIAQHVQKKSFKANFWGIATMLSISGVYLFTPYTLIALPFCLWALIKSKPRVVAA